jgi:branched-chain amino acid aminotransferase
MTNGNAMKIWIDGSLVEAEEARISVLDHGLLYGDGVFEGMRIYGGGLFRLEDHLQRFDSGARAIGLVLPGGVEGVREVVLETARAYGESEGYIRLIVTRGRGAMGVDPTLCENPQLICIATTVSLYPEEKLVHGIDMLTSSLRRPNSDALDPAVKTLNYLNSVLAKREARLRGADEALILNSRGSIAEASVANLFIVRRGELSTPPISDGALPGITRASVLEIARDLSLPTREQSLVRLELIGAEEVFLTGTGARIVPVATLDGVRIGPAGRGRGPVTESVMEAFWIFVKERSTPL